MTETTGTGIIARPGPCFSMGELMADSERSASVVDWMAATHEVGHAVAATLLGIVVANGHIIEDEQVGGICTYVEPRRPGAWGMTSYRQWLRNHTIKTLAGCVAQRILERAIFRERGEP